ncbi:hypothetical protein BVX94_02675 [bacterium B17]|nr:hypothetical protein BVX94_02675 [bacterium B17]
MERKYDKIAVLKGGPSSERDVSLRSGAAVAAGLRVAGYDVQEIDVTGHDIDIPEGIDAVFIALHGEFGEDGQVQQLLEGKGIPFTGSSSVSSRNSFDKAVSKKIFDDNGICTPQYVVMTSEEAVTLEFPVVVKPARQGSSIGIHKVTSKDDFLPALADALSFGGEVVVERFIEGRELTVGVLNGVALPVVEIVAPESWYDYSAKYTKGACSYLVPAPIDEELTAKCKELGRASFEKLGCSGFARVDILATSDGQAYVLELNNIPGFTETSLLPMAAGEYGLSFAELCSQIVECIES